MAVELNRLFFALWPDASTRAACAEAVRDLKLRMQPAGRWTPPERYHLTLFFLGHAVSAPAEAALREVAGKVQAPPFTLTLDHAGSFRRKAPPWWLGARAVPAGLSTLLAQLHDGLLAARVLPDRERFVPHLTVMREGARLLPETAIRPIAWDVREFVLVRSLLDRQPAEYEIAGRWPLQAAPASSPAFVQRDLWEN